MRPEPADVHLPHVALGFAGEDPLGDQLAHAAGAGQAVGAEAGRHEKSADLRLAEAELVVGRERLRAIDQASDLDVLHVRDPAGRVARQFFEPRPVLLEQAAVEI